MKHQLENQLSHKSALRNNKCFHIQRYGSQRGRGAARDKFEAFVSRRERFVLRPQICFHMKTHWTQNVSTGRLNKVTNEAKVQFVLLPNLHSLILGCARAQCDRFSSATAAAAFD